MSKYNTISVHEEFSAKDFAELNKIRNRLRIDWSDSITSGLCMLDFMQVMCMALGIGNIFDNSTHDKIEQALVEYAENHRDILDTGMELDVS